MTANLELTDLVSKKSEKNGTCCHSNDPDCELGLLGVWVWGGTVSFRGFYLPQKAWDMHNRGQFKKNNIRVSYLSSDVPIFI